jgi:predicted DNA-binding transcriptional regulator AlpA
VSNSSIDDLQIIRDPKLAKLLDVTPTTLWRMRQRGDLPPKVHITKGVSGTRLSAIRSLIEARSTR